MYQAAFEIVVILLLVIFNGLLAMSEIAIVSSSKTRLEKWAKDGNANAAAVLALANDPGNFLATVQIGMSLTAILAGVFGGATVADALAAVLDRIVPLGPYSKIIAVATVVLAITFLTVMFGELVPKRVALVHSEKIACGVAGLMVRLSRAMAPIVRMISFMTDVILGMIGVKELKALPVTSDEIKMIIDQGAQAGVFETSEHSLVKSVLCLTDKNVTALMTPRTDIVWVDITDSAEKVLDVLTHSTPSRILVGQGDLDHIQGYMKVRHILTAPKPIESVDFKSHLEKPLFVPESKSALAVLELFKKSGVHIGVVIDEFGQTIGITTTTDLLKAIVGELPVAGRKADLRAVARTDGTWLLDGRLPIDQFKDIINIAKLPEEEKAHFQTLGGFVMHQFGRIPEVADEMEWGGYLFRIISMSGNRIGKVGVARQHPEPVTEGRTEKY